MRKVMVRYRVKQECAEENERLVRAVYEELAASATPDLHYATFKLDDGVSFVHVACNETDGESRLLEVKAFKQFLEDLHARCEEPPVTTDLHELGSFKFWS
ncbi:MAG: hypothetical protein ACYDC2_12765 [Solirubrobacteraceae bacterium]